MMTTTVANTMRPLLLRTTTRHLVVNRTLLAQELAHNRPLPRSTAIRCQTSSASTKSSSNLVVPTTSFGIGTCAGILGSLAGMGGGFVMIPLMTSRRLLGLTQHQAHGTSLFAVMATGLAGAVSYGDQVQYDAAAAVALCGMLSARLGARATAYLSERVLKRALGVLMLTMAPAIPAKQYIMDKYGNKSTDKPPPRDDEDDLVRRFGPSAAIGLCSGFLAGVFGVGGGVIVVPALALATDMNHYQALATSLAAMTPPAAVGTYTHYMAGNVVLRVAPHLAVGAFCGAYLGGKVGLQTNESTLQYGFSGLLGVLGVRTILKV